MGHALPFDCDSDALTTELPGCLSPHKAMSHIKGSPDETRLNVHDDRLSSLGRLV